MGQMMLYRLWLWLRKLVSLKSLLWLQARDWEFIVSRSFARRIHEEPGGRPARRKPGKCFLRVTILGIAIVHSSPILRWSAADQSIDRAVSLRPSTATLRSLLAPPRSAPSQLPQTPSLRLTSRLQTLKQRQRNIWTWRSLSCTGPGSPLVAVVGAFVDPRQDGDEVAVAHGC